MKEKFNNFSIGEWGCDTRFKIWIWAKKGEAFSQIQWLIVFSFTIFLIAKGAPIYEIGQNWLKIGMPNPTRF